MGNRVLGNNARPWRRRRRRRRSWAIACSISARTWKARRAGGASRWPGVVRSIRRGRRPVAPPVCVSVGGETTVTLAERHGKGGRNQEFVLAAAREARRGRHGRRAGAQRRHRRRGRPHRRRRRHGRRDDARAGAARWAWTRPPTWPATTPTPSSRPPAGCSDRADRRRTSWTCGCFSWRA